MKRLFNKEDFLLSSFDKKQRVQSLVIACLIVVFGLLCAFGFMNFLYAFADIVGSFVSGSADIAIRDLGRSLPIFLSFFMCIWTLWLLHDVYRNESEERRNKSIFHKSIVLLAFAGVNILYILIMRIAGRYLSLVEGSPTYIYPLDALLFSLLFVCIGVFGIIYLKKLQSKLPYVVPSRAPVVAKARFIHHFFVTIWMLIAFYGGSAFLYGLFIMDFVHGYQFFSIALLLVFLLPPCYLAFWEFFYNNLKEEKRKELLLPISLCGICLSVIVMVLYFVALGMNTDGPSNAGFGVFPVAFTASVNIATLVVVATPLIVSATALIKALMYRRK